MTAPSPAAAGQAACIRLLLWLDRHGIAERRRNDLRPGLLATANDMSTAFPIISDRALAAKLIPAATTIDFADHAWIHGPATTAYDGGPGLLPAVSVRWDWTRPSPVLRLLVVLVRIGSTTANGLEAVAYRYENPDPAASAHNYWHAQPANSLGRLGTTTLPGLNRPLDTSTPAFPVAATGPVGLTVAALLSLYGTKRLKSEAFQEVPVRDAVRPHLSEVPLWKP